MSQLNPSIPLPFSGVKRTGKPETETLQDYTNPFGQREIYTVETTKTELALPSGEKGNLEDIRRGRTNMATGQFKPEYKSLNIELDGISVEWSNDHKDGERLAIQDNETGFVYKYENVKGIIKYSAASQEEDELFIDRDAFAKSVKRLMVHYDKSWTSTFEKSLPPATTQEERLQRLTQKTAQLNITTDGTCAIIREPVSDKSILAYCQQEPKLDKKSHGQFRPDAFYLAGDERGRKTIAANFKEDPKLQKSLSPEMLEQLAQRIASGVAVHVEHSSTSLNLSAPRQAAQGKSDNKALPPKR